MKRVYPMTRFFLGESMKTVKDTAPKPSVGSGRILLALLIVVSLVLCAWAGTLLYRLQLAKRVERNVVASVQPFVQLLGLASQISIAGIESALLQGTEEERMLVLDEMAKIDFSNAEDFPRAIYDAIESNLDHERLKVREKARSILGSIQSSPWYESTE